MKQNKRRSDVDLGFVLTILIFLAWNAGVLIVGTQLGLAKGRTLGYEEANAENQRMAFARAEAVVSSEYRDERRRRIAMLNAVGDELNIKRQDNVILTKSNIEILKKLAASKQKECF